MRYQTMSLGFWNRPLGQVAGDLLPGRDAQPGRLPPLGFEPVLERLVRRASAHSGSSSTRSLPVGFGRGDFRPGAEGASSCSRTRRGSKATSTGGNGPPGSTAAPRQSSSAVLEVGVGQEQDHRRGLLLAEVLDQGGELVVGDRVGVDGHLPRELERGPLGVGPAREALAAEGVEPGVVEAGAAGVGRGVRLGIGAAVGMGGDPPHRGAELGVDGLLVRWARSSCRNAAVVRGSSPASIRAQDGSGWPPPLSGFGIRRQASSSESGAARSPARRGGPRGGGQDQGCRSPAGRSGSSIEDMGDPR